MRFDKPAIVIDTGVWISRFLKEHSVPAQAVDLALKHFQPIFSEATYAELAEVLSRPKFQAYFSLELAANFLAEISVVARVIAVPPVAVICRDPKDNAFLDVAAASASQCIITGDEDLLTLAHWQGVDMLTPKAFLAKFSALLLEA